MHAYTHHLMMLAIKCPPDNVEIVPVIKAFVKLPWPHIWLNFAGVFTVKFLEQKKRHITKRTLSEFCAVALPVQNLLIDQTLQHVPSNATHSRFRCQESHQSDTAACDVLPLPQSDKIVGQQRGRPTRPIVNEHIASTLPHFLNATGPLATVIKPSSITSR